MKRAALGVFLAASVALSGCALFAPEDQEEVSGRGLSVVEDEGSFDPSEAVDDEGEGADEAAQPAARAPSEGVTSEARAEELESHREEARERANASEDDAAEKGQLAKNPPVPERGIAEPPIWTLADVGFELALLAALSLVFTGLVGAFRRQPLVTALALLLAAFAGWLAVR